ncbi:hypothetical protein BFG07_12720 [Kosakonia cowanii]|nr:hypothetical protein BFG07_12720 [Kosakonia cowanii]
MRRIPCGSCASLSDNCRKESIKKFSLPLFDAEGEFGEGRGARAGGSYPLFLWITLCIRVRKRAASERRRGLRMNWCETRLFNIFFFNQTFK